MSLIYTARVYGSLHQESGLCPPPYLVRGSTRRHALSPVQGYTNQEGH